MGWQPGSAFFGVGLAFFMWVSPMMGIIIPQWVLPLLLILSVLLFLVWPVSATITRLVTDEKKRRIAYIRVWCILVLVATLVVYRLPHLEPNELARFHVIGSQVAFNNRNPNQLIANIYIENDAGDADIVAYSAAGIASVTNNQQDIIKELRKTVSDFIKQGEGLHFTVLAKEKKWFTVQGPVLSDDQVQQYTKGEFAFYFVVSVVLQNK